MEKLKVLFSKSTIMKMSLNEKLVMAEEIN